MGSTDPNYVIPDNKARYLTNPGSSIRFPDEDIPYKMLINFKEYSFISGQSGLIDPTVNANIIDNGSVILPLPLQLNDITGIDATSSSSNFASIFAGAGPSLGDDGIIADLQAYGNMISKIAGLAAVRFLAANSIMGSMVAGSFSLAGKALSSDTMGMLTGQAINPFDTIQFKGVKLKTHSFTWKLSPSSSAESDSLKNLINRIKANMLPSYISVAGVGNAAAHALLKYPALAMVSFYGIDQNYYYKLKPAMITAFSVNYNNSDQLNVYRGGKPAMVNISMDLSELVIHTADDYGGSTYVQSATDLSNTGVSSDPLLGYSGG